MARRRPLLIKNEVYHIIIRSISKVPLFSSNRGYSRFLDTINYYRFQNTPLRFSYFKNKSADDQNKIIDNLEKGKKFRVQIIAFCFMKNHVHFLLKQLENRGISIFMGLIQNSYAKYFNLKNKRNGALFQSMFKAVRIEDDEQLTHVSRYIHLNPCTAYLCKINKLKEYPWSSYPYYLDPKSYSYTFLSPELVLNLFKNRKAYEKFVFDQADYQKELANIKHLTLED